MIAYPDTKSVRKHPTLDDAFEQMDSTYWLKTFQYTLTWQITGHSVAAAAAELLQLCLILCDHIDGSPLGSPVPGILQARTLSGLPFPSPMQESEKWKWSRSVMSDPQRPHGLQPSRLLRPWDFPGKSTGVGCHCLLQGLARMSQSFNKFLWLEEIFQKKHLFVCMCFCFFFVFEFSSKNA